jgi:hypothetical protein
MQGEIQGQMQGQAAAQGRAGAPYPQGYAQGIPPASGGGWAPPRPPAPRDGWRPPRRVERVDGSPFALAYLSVPPATSGMAIGSLVTGIGSVLVSGAVGCLGLAGARRGWGAGVGGAFTILACALGVAAVVLGLAGLRQARRDPAVSGRGLAIAGLTCGGCGIGLAILLLLLTVFLETA